MSAKEKPKLVYPRYSPDELTAADLQTEIDNRQAADNVLSAAISTADSSLSTAISGEIVTRSSADTSLSTAVSQRVSVDLSLSTALNSKLSLSGGTITGNLGITGKMYISGLTSTDQAYVLGLNDSTKEVTKTTVGNLNVSYANSAGYSSNLYESNSDSYVYADNPSPSEIWLTSDIGYTVCVNYATNSFNSTNFAGSGQQFYNTSYSVTTTGSTTNLDCSTSINRILNVSANAITIALVNYTNGQRGTVMLNLTNTGTTAITISNTPAAYKNGTYTGLTSGKYLLEWWTDYTNYAFWRIAKYT